MSNIALEEKIRNLSADYIYQQAVGSLLLLLMSAMEDAEKGVTALPYEIPADVQEIKEEIQAYLIRLEDLLESDAASRMVALEDCMELKKRLLSIYETIYSYFSQWTSSPRLSATRLPCANIRRTAYPRSRWNGLCSLQTATPLWKVRKLCSIRKPTWGSFSSVSPSI